MSNGDRSLAAWFDSLGAAYDASRRLPPEVLAPALRDMLHRTAALGTTPSVLDCGCGTGQILSEIAKLAPVTGLDPAASPLEIARRRLGRDAVLVRADGRNLPFATGSFSISLSAHVIEHISHWCAMVTEMRRVAADGYVVFLFTPGFIRNGPRDLLRRTLRDRGEALTRPGGSADDLLTRLQDLGAPTEIVESDHWRWTRTVPVAESLDFVRRRQYSAFSSVSDHVYVEALKVVEDTFGQRLNEVESIEARLWYVLARGSRQVAG